MVYLDRFIELDRLDVLLKHTCSIMSLSLSFMMKESK